MIHQEFFELLKVLNPIEKGYVLNNFSQSKEKDPDMLLSSKLLKFLLNAPSLPTTEEVLLQVYGESQPQKKQSLRKLVSRARQKVNNLLVASLAMGYSDELGAGEEAKIKVYQKITLCYYLRIKLGRVPQVVNLEDEIIEFAKNFEFYSILIDQLQIRKIAAILNSGEEAGNEIDNQIRHYERINNSINIAIEWNHSIKARMGVASNINEEKFMKEIEPQISFLEKEWKETASVYIKYYLLQHQYIYFNLQSKFSEVKGILHDLIRLVKNNKQIYRKERVSILVDQLASTEIYMGNYDVALDLFYSGKRNFHPASRNYYLTKELEFLSLFYAGRVPEAKKVLNELLNKSSKFLNDFEASKLKMYEAYLAIKENDFKKALKILAIKDEISKDKVGWDIWVRILNILLHIRLKEEDTAAMVVASLKKQINRVSKKMEFREREILVYKILYSLCKTGFTEQPADAREALAELQKEKHKWEPFTAELIPFEELLKICLKIQPVLP